MKKTNDAVAKIVVTVPEFKPEIVKEIASKIAVSESINADIKSAIESAMTGKRKTRELFNLVYSSLKASLIEVMGEDKTKSIAVVLSRARKAAGHPAARIHNPPENPVQVLKLGETTVKLTVENENLSDGLEDIFSNLMTGAVREIVRTVLKKIASKLNA